MVRLVRRLGKHSELALVLVVAFGYPAWMALSWALAGGGPEPVLDNALFYKVGAHELVAGAVALWILWVRGWNLSAMAPRPDARGTAAGAGLFFADVLALAVAALLLAGAMGGPEPGSAGPGKLELSALAMLVACLLDPVFEEFFAAAYVVDRLAGDHGPAFAISASVLVRLVLHVNQGPTAAAIIPLALLHAAVYWRWRSLWPLVVAHAAINFFAIAMVASQTG